MKNKTFLILLFSVLGLCLVATAVHLAWAVYAYQHCSIIYFVGKELW